MVINSVEEASGSNAWNRVLLERRFTRFRSLDVINHVFDSFVELHGDRGIGDEYQAVGGTYNI